MLRNLSLVLLFVLLLQACATSPVSEGAGALASRQAQQYEAQGDYQRAADMYWLAAQKVSTNEAEVFRIKAAEMAFVAGNQPQVRAILMKISEPGLSPTERARKRLVEARLAKLEQRPEELTRLLDFPRQGLPVRLQEDIAALLGERVMFSQAGAREDIQQLIQQQSRSRSPDEAATIWRSLESVSTQEISQWLGARPDAVTKGWLELAYLYRTTPSREARESALHTWQQQYKNHPVWPGTAMGVDQIALPGTIETGLIAVLLPRSGSLAQVSQVVLDGIMSAQRGEMGVRPEVRVYDISAGQQAVLGQYQRAVQEGAGLVIGPMDKEEVDLLMREGLSVPVLSLNYGHDDNAINPQLFQFGLLPEDEAALAAERMWMDGHTQSIAFAPKGNWGERIIQAFGRRFTELGGQVLETGLYDGKENDYSPTIVKALQVRRGDERHSGTRRQDVQAIFVAAAPRQARIFKPLLKFHFAETLPVYATSASYSGTENQQRDRDLNGLYYPEIPWLLGMDPDPADQIPNPAELQGNNRYYPRLFALGVDAYRIAPQLKNMLVMPEQPVRGYSGDIYMDSNNRLHRKLPWAEFQDGLPVMLGARR